MTIAEVAPRIARGELRAESVTEQCLAQIDALNPTLNAFITVLAHQALAGARKADQDIAGGRHLGPLHGIPISLKDLVDLAGTPTTAASRVREDHRARHDAVVTARLKEAGAIVVGKTNLHEFAFGTTSEDSSFGLARNPVDPARSPGGSSGGSAIAIATGMSLGTVGTDTGGSIRIPAACCGVVGLKPTWGEISASGVVPLSRQLDHVGPLAATVTDAWIQYNAMRPAKNRWISTLDPLPVQSLRVAVLTGYFFDKIDADVAVNMRRAIDRLRSAGATVSPVALAHADQISTVYLHLVFGDAAEYHARTLVTRPQDYTPNVRLRLELARYVLAEDYVRALRGKAIITREVDAALEGFDVLLAPSLSIPAPLIGAATVDVDGGPEPVRTAMLRCTQPFNLSGHPAMSLPCGKTRTGLPVGLQLVGHKHATHALVQSALTVERVIAG